MADEPAVTPSSEGANTIHISAGEIQFGDCTVRVDEQAVTLPGDSTTVQHHPEQDPKPIIDLVGVTHDGDAVVLEEYNLGRVEWYDFRECYPLVLVERSPDGVVIPEDIHIPPSGGNSEYD